MSVYDDIQAERDRAHVERGDDSIEGRYPQFVSTYLTTHVEAGRLLGQGWGLLNAVPQAVRDWVTGKSQA